MKSKNNNCATTILICISFVFLFKLCNNNKENNTIDSSYKLTDTLLNVLDTIRKDSIIVIAKEKKKNRKTKYNSSNSETTKYKRKNKTNTYSSSNKISRKECTASQCYGTSKKGNRCRNMTRSCNGYCWRHGG